MKKPRGILCPKCASPMRVHSTKRPTAGLVVRYRKCPACSAMSRTEERVRLIGGK